MFSKEKKEEIRLYFETHMLSPKEVAEAFNIGYRTLCVWIKKEGWEKGKGLESVAKKNIRGDLLKQEFGGILEVSKEKIKENIKENLGTNSYQNIDRNKLDEILEGLSEDLLFKMLNVEFLHKNMLSSFLIAKEELLKMRRNTKINQNNPAIISSAQKLIEMLGNIQRNLYDDKILSKTLDSGLEKQVESLSNEELLKLIEQG